MNKHIINDFYQELGLAGVKEFLARREKKGGPPYIVLKEGFLESCRRKDMELVEFLKDHVKPTLHEEGVFHLVAGFGATATLNEAFELFPHYKTMNHEKLLVELIRKGNTQDSQTILSLCKSISPLSVYVFLTRPFDEERENEKMFDGMMKKFIIPKNTLFHDFELILKKPTRLNLIEFWKKCGASPVPNN